MKLESYRGGETEGSIAIINENNYNKGKLFAKKNFKNSDWEKIVLTTRLPDKDEFIGITLCIRAIQITGKEHSVVEFKNPKLEFGMLSVIDL